MIYGNGPYLSVERSERWWMFYDLAEGNMKRANRFKVHTGVPDFFNPEQWNALVSASPAADKFVPLLMTLIPAESSQ